MQLNLLRLVEVKTRHDQRFLLHRAQYKMFFLMRDIAAHHVVQVCDAVDDWFTLVRLGRIKNSSDVDSDFPLSFKFVSFQRQTSGECGNWNLF